MIVVMKKEQMWRKSRNSCRKSQRTKINNFSKHQQADQREKQKVGVLIYSIQL